MAIIIDTTLSISNFSKVIEIYKENLKEIVITFISPIQEEYVACKISNAIKLVETDWSINERLKPIRICSYWDK